ncbi:hypothetical protein BZG36_04629 [Bifiguratus adelaidae]|uniref:Rho-GAP domain-containing protein n=1 Tax=Bifiguratus adelaidae TaxID=1938954 RepID=A0A261XUW0_9FUNG|nr:hypothetical protein BZG36_04629 [Bifiguratus adelaidae]
MLFERAREVLHKAEYGRIRGNDVQDPYDLCSQYEDTTGIPKFGLREVQAIVTVCGTEIRQRDFHQKGCLQKAGCVADARHLLQKIIQSGQCTRDVFMKEPNMVTLMLVMKLALLHSQERILAAQDYTRIDLRFINLSAFRQILKPIAYAILVEMLDFSLFLRQHSETAHITPHELAEMFGPELFAIWPGIYQVSVWDIAWFERLLSLEITRVQNNRKLSTASSPDMSSHEDNYTDIEPIRRPSDAPSTISDASETSTSSTSSKKWREKFRSEAV